MAFSFSKSNKSSSLSLIDWSEVSGQRWDARYHRFKSHKPHWIKLGNYVRIQGGKRLPKQSSFSVDITPYRYLKVENLEESGIDYPNMPYIDEETYNVLKRYSLAESDVVLSIAGTIGKVSIFHQPANEEVILTENCAKLRTTSSHLSPELLRILLQCSFAQEQMAVAAPQTTIQKLALERIAQILVPAVLNLKQQQDAVALITYAESQRSSKESDARRLLVSFLVIMEGVIHSNLPVLKYKQNQILFWSCIEGPINPDRYALDLSPLIDDGWKPISEFGRVIHQSISFPSSSVVPMDYDLIRIDDLPNFPQNAIVRTEFSTDLKGSFQQAEPGDILIARLGPSIENAKFIIAPDSSNELICSNEFIRFRCNEDVNPFFLIGMVRTAYFRRLMLTKARGAVPSRRRLSRSDFLQIPFPSISTIHQNEIADRYIKAIDTARELIVEAEDIIRKAKEEVETILLGG